MTVKALPGSSLEVIETELFLHLLVSLLANSTRLDGGCQGAQVDLRRQVGEIVFLFSRHPMLADRAIARSLANRFFSCAGAMLVSPHDGRIDHHVFVIVIARQRLSPWPQLRTAVLF
jgi:hypothetical protein